MTTIGERVRLAREAKGLTQTALGRAVGMDRDKVNKVEHGTRDVSGGELINFAQALDVPVEKLLREAIKVQYRGPKDRSGMPAAEATLNRIVDNYLDACALAWPLEQH